MSISLLLRRRPCSFLMFICSLCPSIHGIQQALNKSEMPTIPERPLRLIGESNNQHQGLIEVFIHDDGLSGWGSICDDNFGYDEARVVCRQLGYQDADDIFKKATYKYNVPARNVIYFDGLYCDGHERSLDECGYSSQVDTTCHDGNHVAGVTCSVKKDVNGGHTGHILNHMNLLGWGGFFWFIMMGLAISGRRYRQRRRGMFGHAPTVSTVYSNPAPGPSQTAYPAPPPGSYPSQPPSYQPTGGGIPGEDPSANINTAVGLPSSHNATNNTCWATPGHYVTTPNGTNGMNGTQYQHQQQQQLQPQHVSNQHYAGAVPNCTITPPADNTVMYPPYAYTNNGFVPNVPPPSYDSLSKDNGETLAPPAS